MTGPGSIVARRQRQRERMTAAVMVPGFPEITRAAAQCRLCAFARGTEDEQDLLHWVHDTWLAGDGVKKLETQTALSWSELGLAPVTSRCFDRHFKNHVSFNPLIAETALTALAQSAPAAAAPAAVSLSVPAVVNAPRAVSDSDREAFDGMDGSDFFDMHDIIERLKARVSAVDAATTTLDENGRLNSYALVLLTRLASVLQQAIEASNRMKNSDRIAKGLLQGHTKRYVSKLADPLVAEFDTILEFMHQGQTAAAQGALELLAAEGMRNILRTAAESSIRESCKVYKIH